MIQFITDINWAWIQWLEHGNWCVVVQPNNEWNRLIKLVVFWIPTNFKPIDHNSKTRSDFINMKLIWGLSATRRLIQAKATAAAFWLAVSGSIWIGWLAHCHRGDWAKAALDCSQRQCNWQRSNNGTVGSVRLPPVPARCPTATQQPAIKVRFDELILDSSVSSIFIKSFTFEWWTSSWLVADVNPFAALIKSNCWWQAINDSVCRWLTGSVGRFFSKS